MKKIYQAPQVKVYIVQVEHQLLVSSTITPSGSSNTLQFSNDHAGANEEARVKAYDFEWNW